MINKIQDILNSNFKYYSQVERKEIIERLALIGLRSLQLETKEPIEIDMIYKISNSITEKMDESGNLRKEISNIKKQLSKLSNKFEVLSHEKSLNAEQMIKYSINTLYSKDKPIKHGNLIPPQHPNNSNIQQLKDNRQNQFLSLQKLYSNSNISNVKSQNAPQSNEKSLTNSQSCLPPNLKLFVNDENSKILAKNINKKPSSAWRIGGRSNSLNNYNNYIHDEDYVNYSQGNILPSNINDSQLTDIQKKRLMKNHEQIAPKVTETKPQIYRYDSVQPKTRHHLDDKDIKDILSEEQLKNQNNLSDNKKNFRSNYESSGKENKLRKKSDSNLQLLQPSNVKQFENNNESYPNLNDHQFHEYVSLSQPLQFLPAPLQPTQAQLQSFRNQNNINIPNHQQQTINQNINNPNFKSPNFKDGRDNSINTQYNTTEQKKVGYGYSAQYNNYNNLQQQQNINQQISPYNQQEQQQQQTVNLNHFTNNVQIQQQPHQNQQKYATTKSQQKRQEMSKQKMNQENKKDQFQNKKKQPNYLKNVTSKIKDEIRHQKETHKGSINHDVIEFFIQDPPIENKKTINESEKQKQFYKGYYNDKVDMRQHNKQIYDDYQQIVNDENLSNNDNQLQHQQLIQANQGQNLNIYGAGYQNVGVPHNFEQQEKNQSYNIHNYNLRRNEQYKDQAPQQGYNSRNQMSNIPPLHYIDESQIDLRNNVINPQNKYSNNQNQQQSQRNKNVKNYRQVDDDSTFDQRNQYITNNYEDLMRNNINYMNDISNENFNHMNIPHQIQNDRSFSNFGEQNSFNHRCNEQSSFYSNNNSKINMDQQNNNPNITSNSQNLLNIANNLLQSPFVHQFSNSKQNKKDSSIVEYDKYQPQIKRQSQIKPQYPEQYSDHFKNKHNYGNGFDVLNNSYQNSLSIQQSQDIYNKKMPSNKYQNQKDLPQDLDQSSMLQENYEKQNSSISSSFTSFKPDHNMKEVLQKDGFFQKIFEGDEQHSNQKFDNTFTSLNQSNNNYGNMMMSSKTQMRQNADILNNSYYNNKLKDDSINIVGNDNNYNNPQKYSQIQQKIEINKNNYQSDGDENDGELLDKRLYNFFEQ